MSSSVPPAVAAAPRQSKALRVATTLLALLAILFVVSAIFVRPQVILVSKDVTTPADRCVTYKYYRALVAHPMGMHREVRTPLWLLSWTGDETPRANGAVCKIPPGRGPQQ